MPNRVRPNQDVVVAATVMRLELSDTFTVKAVVRHLIEGKQAEEICSAEYTFYRPATYNIRMKVISGTNNKFIISNLKFSNSRADLDERIY